MLKIENLTKLGEGVHKRVYQHPDMNNFVIKVMRPEKATNKSGRISKNSFRGDIHQGIYRQFRRELIQYLQLCKVNYANNLFIFPVETVSGFIMTTDGLGLVVEKIISPTGRPMTLSNMVLDNKFNNIAKQDLERFFKDCYQQHIIFDEVNSKGIMYTESRQNRPEFVLVDGMGAKSLINLRVIHKSFNQPNIKAVRQKIYDEISELNTLNNSFIDA